MPADLHDWLPLLTAAVAIGALCFSVVSLMIAQSKHRR